MLRNKASGNFRSARLIELNFLGIKMFMRALYIIGQVESIFSSKVVILPNNCQNSLEIQTVKLSYFLILAH